MRLPQASIKCIAFSCTGAFAIISGCTSEDPAEFLFSITRTGLFGDSHICGGTTIGPKAVLTAAHCVDGSAARSLKVKYGGVDRTRLPYSNSVSEIRIHPAYKSISIDNDFAILCLTSLLLEFEDTARAFFPILSGQRPAAREEVELYGWGRTSGMALNLPRDLHVVTMRVLASAECKQEWEDRNVITQNLGCVESFDGSFCSGDDGGPVMDIGRLRVYGVMSYTENLCPANSTEKPNVYTEIAAVHPWILQNSF